MKGRDRPRAAWKRLMERWSFGNIRCAAGPKWKRTVSNAMRTSRGCPRPSRSRREKPSSCSWAATAVTWRKKPSHYSPTSGMRGGRLSDEQAKAITSYLMTLGEKTEKAEVVARLSDPEVIARGKGLVRKYGCYGCHNIPGMENEARIGVELTTFGSKTLEELFFGNRTEIPHTWDDWTYNKLKEPRIYATERIEQLMPQFDLADADVKALRVFLTSRTDQRVPERYVAAHGQRIQNIVNGQRLVQYYNCVGCHVIEGKGGYIRALYSDK